MRKFKARIRPVGSHISTEVRIEAENFMRARDLLEAQYGKGCIVVAPTEIR